MQREPPIPVQVLDVLSWPDGRLSVTLTCCFCGKKHEHGPGVSHANFPLEGSLGARVPHCGELQPHEYELMLDAWRAKGSQLKKAPSLKRKSRLAPY